MSYLTFNTTLSIFTCTRENLTTNSSQCGHIQYILQKPMLTQWRRIQLQKKMFLIFFVIGYILSNDCFMFLLWYLHYILWCRLVTLSITYFLCTFLNSPTQLCEISHWTVDNFPLERRHAKGASIPHPRRIISKRRVELQSRKIS